MVIFTSKSVFLGLFDWEFFDFYLHFCTVQRVSNPSPLPVL